MTNQELIERYRELHREYSEYRAEQHACGHEAVSFEVWADIAPDTAKADAQARWLDLEARDELDLY